MHLFPVPFRFINRFYDFFVSDENATPSELRQPKLSQSMQQTLLASHSRFEMQPAPACRSVQRLCNFHMWRLLLVSSQVEADEC